MNKEVNKIFEDFSKSIAAKPASSELKDIAESVAKKMLRYKAFDLTCIEAIEKEHSTAYLNVILWAKYRQMDNASYTKEEHEIMLKFNEAKDYLINFLYENTKKLQPKTKPQTLKDCFQSDDDYIRAISIAQNTNPCIIDKNLNYCLGERGKSAITEWVNLLIESPDFSFTKPDNKTLVTLLNKTFSGLNMGNDGRTLKAYNKQWQIKIKAVK